MRFVPLSQLWVRLGSVQCYAVQFWSDESNPWLGEHGLIDNMGLGLR